MATKQEIITAIDSKIIAKGNISAVDTNKILKDILEFSDKPLLSINGFDFGNIDKPLETKQLASIKVNFTGIQGLSCSIYLCIESRIQEQKKGRDNLEWLFIPLKEEEYKILLSFLPNINKKEMYLTYIVPFLPAENTIIDSREVKNLTSNANVKSSSSFPMMIIGLGLLLDQKKRAGLHIILPEPGHISTSMALSYKPNNFNFSMFSKDMQEFLKKMLDSIIDDNDLINEEK